MGPMASGGMLITTVSGGNISWYADKGTWAGASAADGVPSADNQLNTSGTTYEYLVIGK